MGVDTIEKHYKSPKLSPQVLFNGQSSRWRSPVSQSEQSSNFEVHLPIYSFSCLYMPNFPRAQVVCESRPSRSVCVSVIWLPPYSDWPALMSHISCT